MMKILFINVIKITNSVITELNNKIGTIRRNLKSPLCVLNISQKENLIDNNRIVVTEVSKIRSKN